MQAPWPVTDDGQLILPEFWCPLCHRKPVDGRIALCGHSYCYWCLRDIQVTAALHAVIPRCKICNSNISDRGPLAHPAVNRQTPLQASSASDAAQEAHEKIIENVWTTNPTPIPRPLASATPRSWEQSEIGNGLQTNRSEVPTGQQCFRTPTPILDQNVQQYHTHHLSDIFSSPAAASSASPPPVTPPETPGTTSTSSQCLEDMYFHIAGKLPSFSHRRAEILIRNHGGKAQDRINNRTDYVILGKKASEMALDHIKEHNVTTLNMQELLNLIEVRSRTISAREESMTSPEGVVVTTTPAIDPQLADEEANLKEELNRVRQREGEIRRRLRDLKSLSGK